MAVLNRSHLFDRFKPRDEVILLAIARIRNPVFTAFLKFITYTGTGHAYFAAAIILGLLNFFKIEIIPLQWVFLKAMLSALLAWPISRAIKNHFARVRPSLKIAIIPIPTCQSFPSGHAASAAALYTTLALIQHPSSNVALAWAITVIFSRLYLGVHYPTDVLAGTLLGTICGVVGFGILQVIP